MAVFERLGICWRHCNVGIAFKITGLDAVSRSKLLYGIDSAQLTRSHQRRIEVVQLKGLSKILKRTTTCVERDNTNAEVFRRPSEAMKNETSDGKQRNE